MLYEVITQSGRGHEDAVRETLAGRTPQAALHHEVEGQGVVLVDLFISERNRVVSYGIAQVGIILTIGLTFAVSQAQTQILFDGAYIRDPMSDVLKVGVLVISFLAFLYAKDYLRDRDLFKGEFYTLGLFAVLGMCVMISANSFLV